MKHALITFWDKVEKPMRITEKEYKGILSAWETNEHFLVQGEVIHKKAIKRIKPPPKPEPLLLPEPSRPLSKETLQRLKELSKKYSFNS